jgi:hypothetical protein
MMPPDSDLKNHLANRRSLAEARATYLAPCALTQPSQNESLDSPKMREEIEAPQNGTPAR